MSTSTSGQISPPAIEAAAADWVTRCDAGLTSAEQQIFQDWLGADARHADAFDRLTEAWSVFDRVQGGGAISAVLAGLAVRAKHRRRRQLQGAVAAMILLGSGLFLLRSIPSDPGPMSRLAVNGQVEEASIVANNAIRQLPDGSIVELKVGAEISVHYAVAARRVTLLKGEAYFRVMKDATRPFYVEANGIAVRAVGTAFSVQLRPTAVEIFVKEGAVDVDHAVVGQAHAGGDRRIVRVNAGKRFVALTKLRLPRSVKGTAPVHLESFAEPQPVSEAEMNHQLAWRDTRQDFSGTTLSEAVALLNRHNLTQLLIEDPMVGGLRVSGSFRSDNPEGFARIVGASFDLQAERRGEHLLLLRRAP